MDFETVKNYLKGIWKALLGNVPAGKHLLRSKTFWVNFLTLAATISGYLSPKWSSILLPLANIGLRIVTTQGITFFEE